MEELIIRNTTTPIKTFKDARLNEAAQKLVKLHEKQSKSFGKAKEEAQKAVETFNREAGAILGKIAMEESYKQDGFKDVKDFAINGLYLDPRKVYTLVSYGKMYHDPEVPESIKGMTPDNFDAVKSVGIKHLKEAAESGVDFSSMTQKELKEYAKEHRQDKPHKPKVMPIFDVTIYGTDKVFHGHNSADMETALREMISPEAPDSVEVVKLPSIKEQLPLISGSLPQEREVKRFLYMGSGRAIVAEFRPAVKEKSEKAKKADQARADMIERMKANGLTDEQIANIIG